MATTSRVRIKINTEGDLVYGQEFEAPPTVQINAVVNNRALTTVPVSQAISASNYIFIVPPTGNLATIFISLSQTDLTPLALKPDRISAIAVSTSPVWLSSSAPVTIQFMQF